MTPQVQPLEQCTLVAPLGLRFWDVATGTPAESGLSVMAFPDAFPERTTAATWNAAGVYSFSGLPGLRLQENGAGDDAYWAATPPTVPFTVSVFDPANRYLPFQLPLLLPVRGLYGLASSPPLSIPMPDATWVPIFSSAARPAGGVAAMIYATLQDPSGAAASWALVTAQAAGGAPAIGLADARGVISLPLPYPELNMASWGSPATLAPVSLSQQKWPVEVRVFWSALAAGANAPVLEDLLHQSEAAVWRDSTLSAPAGSFTLTFGTELVLRSTDAVSGRDLPYLLVTAERSPL